MGLLEEIGVLEVGRDRGGEAWQGVGMGKRRYRAPRCADDAASATAAHAQTTRPAAPATEPNTNHNTPPTNHQDEAVEVMDKLMDDLKPIDRKVGVAVERRPARIWRRRGRRCRPCAPRCPACPPMALLLPLQTQNPSPLHMLFITHDSSSTRWLR